MTQKRPNRAEEANKRLGWRKIAEEATVDAYGEYEQITSWEEYLGSRITLPCDCRVDKKEGTLLNFGTDKYGSTLLAVIKVDGNKYKVDATTVTILDRKSSKYLDAFKKWL